MAYTQSVFVLDLSSFNGKNKTLERNHMGFKLQSEVETTRTTTDFEWVNEWIAKKVADEILVSTPTKRTAIITYGGINTKNIVHSEGTKGYTGIEEIYGSKPADIEMLEILRSMRAREEDDGTAPGDPISALVVAIRRLQDDEWIGKSRKRVIYLITDGRNDFDKTNVEDEILEQLKPDPNGKSMKDKNGIKLVVVSGVDFDDIEFPFREENKSEVKAKNEVWWSRTISRELPDSQGRLVSAIDVITSNSGPTISSSNSTARSSNITLGRKELANQDDENTLLLSVHLYKVTTLARPLKQTLISKPALEKPSTIKRKEKDEKRLSQFLSSQSRSQTQIESQYGNPNSNPYGNASTSKSGFGGGGSSSSLNRKAVDDDADDEPSVHNSPTYRVVKHSPMYRHRDKLAAHKLIVSGLPLEKDEQEPEPLASDDPNVVLAYKLGRDHVLVEKVDQFSLKTEAGIEVICFHHEEKCSASLSMGEVSWVFGGDDASKIAISALAKVFKGDIPSMSGKPQTSSKKKHSRKVGLVRFVAKDGIPAKLGILFSPKHQDYLPDEQKDALCLVAVPMAQDYRPYPFESLTSVTLKTGVELKEHARIPKDQQISAMDNLIDGMNLDEFEVDEKDEPCPWFDVYSSFNPAIHSIKAASLWRVMNPESPETDLPKSHPEITKYLNSPLNFKEGKLRKILDEAKTALGIQKKVAVTKSAFRKREQEEEENGKEENGKEENGDTEDEAQERENKRIKKLLGDDSDSDDDEDEDKDKIMINGTETSSSSNLNSKDESIVMKPKNHLGKLKQLNLQNPLDLYNSKFEELQETSDDPEADGAELTDELFLVIRILVGESSASGKKLEEESELIKSCLRSARDKSIEFELTHKYNSFLKTFKKQLKNPLNYMDKTNRNVFWEKVFKGDRLVSLITEQENYSDLSEYTESDSKQFVEIED